ncbi:hypothetical protein KC644_01860 [Candidatus Berkelbacteria bacterium]|nr:hypothetical protein [Candidatus Berkelbacteria bacterium]
MNPEQPDFNPETIETYPEEETENRVMELGPESQRQVGRGVAFYDELGELAGTRNDWIRAGHPSIRRLLEESGLEPAHLVNKGKIAVKLWTKSQIDEIYRLRKQRLQYSQQPEGLVHPETEARVHSIGGWSRELKIPRNSLTQMLMAIEAQPALEAKINNGRVLWLYNELTVRAAQAHHQQSRLGVESIACDPLSGKVLGSAKAWVEFLGKSSVDVVNRRVNDADIERYGPTGYHQAKLYSQKTIEIRLAKFINSQQQEMLEQLGEQAQEMHSSPRLKVDAFGKVRYRGEEFILNFNSRPLDQQLAFVTSPEHWQVPVFSVLSRVEQPYERLLENQVVSLIKAVPEGRYVDAEGHGSDEAGEFGTIFYWKDQYEELCDGTIIYQLMRKGTIKSFVVPLVGRAGAVRRQVDVYRKADVEQLIETLRAFKRLD